MENLEQTPLELTVSEVVPASIEQAYVAWIDPYSMKCFMMPGDGVLISAVDNRPALGGHFLVEMSTNGQTLPHRGEYKIMERPYRLSFTWDSPFSAPGSFVELNFRAIDPEHTEITLHHENFTDEQSRTRHMRGWKNILKNLRQYLT